MGKDNFYGKRERMMRHYDSLKNFVGNNEVFLGGDVLYVSTNNNGAFDMIITADGVSPFTELYNKKVEEKYTVITDASDIAKLAGKDVKVESNEVLNAFTGDVPYFKNVIVRDAEVDKAITMKATEKITLDGITLAGGKDGVNGKLTYATKELLLKNITAQEGTTLYNAFEGYQKTDDADYSGLKKLVAENLDIDCPSLTHNIINVYTPADGAEIIIRNSKFNLTVDNTNVLRLANYINAENVKVTFENCEWNYEDGITQNDWRWAGLVIYQPASSDLALGGDTSKLATWKFKFKDCNYNGVKVMDNGFGEHSQVLYMFNLNNGGLVSDPARIEGLVMEFE